LLQLREVEAINMIAKKEPKKRGRPAKVVETVITDIPEAPDVPLKALILGICNNPTWVRGRIDGFSVNVKCPAQVSRRLLGKEVSVTLVHSDLGDYYQYIA
jgi:hypothetical protein